MENELSVGYFLWFLVQVTDYTLFKYLFEKADSERNVLSDIDVEYVQYVKNIKYTLDNVCYNNVL